MTEKLKRETEKVKLCESLLSKSGEKILKSLEDLNYQQMHLLGLSLKNSDISRLFIRTVEGLEPDFERDMEIAHLKLK